MYKEAKKEIDHWKARRHKKNKRRLWMVSLIKLFCNDQIYKVMADVGCGPRCGVFEDQSFVLPCHAFAVDPLWNEYAKHKLIIEREGVVRILGYANTFKLPVMSDFICSFNSLDHSGDIKASIDNIMANLCKGGTFLIHCHLRDKPNAGHPNIVTEDMLDRILSQYQILKKKIYSKDPLMLTSKKEYRAYVATVQHC